MPITDPKKIEEVLTRGVEAIYPAVAVLRKKMIAGERLKLYCGYDPSGPSLHLGHMITLKKLSQFQKLGHEVIMLIGDFTGMIGDPTDKTVARKKMAREQVLEKAQNYKKQASKFLKFVGTNSAKILYNSQWLDKMSFVDVVELASNFTVQQMIIRDMFERRFYGEVKCKKCSHIFAYKNQIVNSPSNKDFGEGTCVVKYVLGFCPKCGHRNKSPRIVSLPKPIYLHEFLYPLAQAYDSVAMDVDLEIGGKDQTFNMLCGRDLLKILKNKEKCVLATKLFTDSSGKKMGKTEGNMVNLDEKPEGMYGKIMAWPDSVLVLGLELLTDVSLKEIKEIAAKLQSGRVNPRDIKAKLAREVITLFSNSISAGKAEKEFNKVFKENKLPSKIPVATIREKTLSILDLLVKTGLSNSKSEAKRLVLQRGVKIAGTIQDDWQKIIDISPGLIIQIGKRKICKIV